MKIGRNDPCPCGSGKKYKQCCLLKPQNAVTKNNDESSGFGELESDSGEQDTCFGERKFTVNEQEILLNMLNSFRSFSLNRKPHIKEYQKIRKLHGEIVNSMAEYYEQGKFEQKVDLDYVPPVTPVHKEDGKMDANIILLESNFDPTLRRRADEM